MQTAPPDIETREDCEALVRAFYERTLTDPVLGFIFTDVAGLDLESHVPKVTSFWETILLGARSYSGGAFAPHAALNAKVRLFPGHFERWLWLWRTTVDEQFTGPRAEEAKAHAERVAAAFVQRLGNVPAAPGSAPDRAPAGGLVITQSVPSASGTTRSAPARRS